jgi:SAM-dependent methyltransferase
MSTTTTPTTGTAPVQGPLWGARASDWAEIQEPQSLPLYRRLVELAAIGDGTDLLDAGCASGVFLEVARNAGASVTGFDAAAPLLDIARRRVPDADIVRGDLESLPFADSTFDVVAGMNAFQYAASPVGALREARRVLRPGGLVAAAVWGEADHCDVAPYVAALGACLPPPPPGAPGPFALSSPGALEALLVEAGFRPTQSEEVATPWEYPDEDRLLRGLLAAGPAVKAIERAGEDRVRAVTLEALAPFRRDGGGYYLENALRLVVATR